MKRIALMLAGGFFLVGCAHETDKPAAQTTDTAPAANSTPSQPMSITAPAMPAVKPITPFELAQDDKVYVFATAEALGSFQGGQAQPTVVEKPNLSPKGKTVIVEAADDNQAAALLAGYEKEHGTSHK